MYLSAKLFLWSSDKDKDNELKENIKKHTGLDLEPQEISFKIFQWRKANAIHNWFVENVQEGNDDCKEYYVDREQLKQLLEIINRILGKSGDNKEKIIAALDRKNLAEELLPTQSGFFFGDTEYDKDYFEDLERTQRILNDIFENEEKYKGIDFYYTSGW